jgi:hypothetical protein
MISPSRSLIFTWSRGNVLTVVGVEGPGVAGVDAVVMIVVK